MKNNKQPEQLEFDFVNKCIDSVDNYRKAEQMSPKEISDYLILHFPVEYKWGAFDCAVMDRAILILQELDDKQKSECCCKN